MTFPSRDPINEPIVVRPTWLGVKWYGATEKTCERQTENDAENATEQPNANAVHDTAGNRNAANGEMRESRKFSSLKRPL